MRNERLFGILYTLLSEDSVTAKELADRFEVSTRTIYRDIDLLSSFQIPVYASKGKNGGIHLLDNFKFDKSLLSKEEQDQILFALQSMKKLGVYEESDMELSEKMQRIFQNKGKEWIHIDFTDWKNSSEQDTFFHFIKQAVLEERKIEFDYYNLHGEKSKRIVEPLQICFKHKAWYVQAYEEEKSDYRFFKVTRIKNLKVLNETFIRDMPRETIVKEPQELNIIYLELEITKEMAYRVYDEFENDEITVTKEGNFRIKTAYQEGEWVYGFLLSFGEYLRVISPTEVIEKIKEKLTNSMTQYL